MAENSKIEWRELAALLHFSRTSRTEGGLRERAEAQIPSTYEDAA
jgi:hypothetical protein